MYYPVVLILILAIAIIIERYFKEHLWHSFKERLICTIIALTSILIWDYYAIPRKHWVFSGEGIAGIYLGPIPIEEFFWALFTPYFWLTIYKAVHSVFDKKHF